MNNQILQKCVDELNKTTPDLSYLKGMLETVIAMSSDGSKITTNIPMVPFTDINVNKIGLNEKKIVDQNEITPAEHAAQEAIAMVTGGLQPAKSGIIENNVILN